MNTDQVHHNLSTQ